MSNRHQQPVWLHVRHHGGVVLHIINIISRVNVVTHLLVYLTTIGVLTLAGSSAAAEPGPDIPSTAQFVTYEASAYHIYADDIDWAAPVGVVYYFGGDYFRSSDSEVFQPRGAVMRSLADEAARRNMVLVVPLIPTERGTQGYTWWEDGEQNRKWFHSFHGHITAKVQPDPDMIWFMGYSGGAEFIAQQLLSQYPKTFGTGGALLIGGGGPPETFTQTTTQQRDAVQLMWVVGAQDTAGSTNPPDWSALDAAQQGEEFYRRHGYNRTHLEVLDDTDHLDYDLDAILAATFAHYDVPRADTRLTMPPLGWAAVIVALAVGVGAIIVWRRKHTPN